MVKAPEITDSTAEERREYIKKKYPCIASCDMCGLCKVFRGRDAEHAFERLYFREPFIYRNGA